MSQNEVTFKHTFVLALDGINNECSLTTARKETQNIITTFFEVCSLLGLKHHGSIITPASDYRKRKAANSTSKESLLKETTMLLPHTILLLLVKFNTWNYHLPTFYC